MASASLFPAAAPAAAGNRIGIGRIRLAIRSSRGSRAPPGSGIDDLRGAIADALDTLLDPGDPAVWVVRKIALDAHAGGGDLGHEVALQLREAIARVLRGEIADGVIRYPDRSAWLAALLWDHVRGEARGRWCYARFAALEALPLAWVPRQLFAAEPELALPVLCRLASAGRLLAFVSAVGEAGIRALLPLVLARNGTADAVEAAALARRLAANAAPALPSGSSRALLAAVVQSAIERPGARPPSRATAAAAQRRAQTIALRPPAPGARFPGGPPESAAVTRLSPASAQRRSESRPREGDPAEAPRPSAGPEPGAILDSPHAGIFLLWRSVRELDLESLWPDEVDPGHAALTLAAALAGPDRRAAWVDPALHWLAGFVPGPKQGPLEADPSLPARFAAHMAERSAPKPLRPVERRFGRLKLIQDGETEDWLALGPLREVASFRAAGAHPAMRDPAPDLTFFGARGRRQRPWALLARAAYGDLARRLTGLERSSAWWVWSNCLAGWGRLRCGDAAELVMPPVALDLVLRMTGLDGTTVRLADGRSYAIALPGRG